MHDLGRNIGYLPHKALKKYDLVKYPFPERSTQMHTRNNLPSNYSRSRYVLQLSINAKEDAKSNELFSK